MSNWRVGHKVPLNVYEDDQPMFQCHTPEEAQRIVQLLQDGERDKARLDWLAARKTEVHFWNNNGNRKCSFIENWDAPDAADALLEAPTLREAIDAAMGAPDQEGT